MSFIGSEIASYNYHLPYILRKDLLRVEAEIRAEWRGMWGGFQSHTAFRQFQDKCWSIIYRNVEAKHTNEEEAWVLWEVKKLQIALWWQYKTFIHPSRHSMEWNARRYVAELQAELNKELFG